MDDHTSKEKYLLKIDELSRTVERLVTHNIELKTLILRSGNDALKSNLDKLMRKSSGAGTEREVAYRSRWATVNQSIVDEIIASPE